MPRPLASPRADLWQVAQSLAKISAGDLPWAILVWASAMAGKSPTNRPIAGEPPGTPPATFALSGGPLIFNPNPRRCGKGEAFYGRENMIAALLVNEDFV